MEKVKVLIAAEEGEIRSTAADILSGVEYLVITGETGCLDEVMELVESRDPDVVLISAAVGDGNGKDGYRLAESLSESYPGTAIVIVEKELKEETMRKAIFSGAGDVLLYPFSPAKLVDSVYRSYQSEQKKQKLRQRRSGGPRDKFRQGRIDVVFSTKGGVGKTFISTNLAVSLAQKTGAKVVLVDLDLDFGNASLALNVVPRYTISDVVNEIRNLDREMIESFLVSHSSGIKILAANVQPRMSEFINAAHVELILKVLQSSYDYIIVDMPARFDSALDPVFQVSDSLLLVTTPEVATIRNVKACLKTLDSLNYPQRKVRLLLNKAGISGEIKPQDVASTLNHTLFAILPAEHKQVSASLNKGIPVVRLYPQAKVSRSIDGLAEKVGGITGKRKQRRSVFYRAANKRKAGAEDAV